MRRKIFIYGSCVARDIVRVTRRFEVSQYVARQTITSGFSPPLAIDADLSSVGSNFSRKALQGDLASNVGQTLRRYAVESDAIIIDIATEHWGVTRLEGDAYLTLSTELAKSGLLARVSHSPAIVIGSDRHFGLFKRGAATLKRQLDALDASRKTLVLCAPFARETTDGEPVPPSKNKTAAELNSLMVPYVEELQRLGFQLGKTPPKELVVSTKDHQWGPALYHYVDEMYEWWADEIDQFIDTL
ncbi:DUF6270 domain-containing protein [Schaalia vaccimaxillae]|uniref:DUF6270 domain-containing protein n=1 Tax=Schaalia vaccimaxillae TaxID=183916 RepID=UPI0003B42E0B|nr:DUF6270 domain-containing protein [Schaalia vaccimaxillae]